MDASNSPITFDRYSRDVRHLWLHEEGQDPIGAWLHIPTRTWWVERSDGTFASLSTSGFDVEIRQGVDLLVETIIRLDCGEFIVGEEAGAA